MGCSFLGIIFRAGGQNNDMWHSIQVHSTEPIYNMVIMGDWSHIFTEEYNINQTYGFGKRTRRDTTG